MAYPAIQRTFASSLPSSIAREARRSLLPRPLSAAARSSGMANAATVRAGGRRLCNSKDHSRSELTWLFDPCSQPRSLRQASLEHARSLSDWTLSKLQLIDIA
jgi:hypothetical protein